MRPDLIALALIVLLGGVVRCYDLSGVPTELIADEIDLYNSAYSIVTTGHDVDGKLMPFLYTRFGRNPPMYAIAEYPSTLVFGRTPLGLRLPAVLFGLATILLIYGIAFELTRRRDVALVAALLQATQPIFIHFSRVAWEPASELPFLLGGCYALLRAFGSVEPGAVGPSFKGLALGALLLGLTCYTYMAGWFYALVLGGGLFALNTQAFRTRWDWWKAGAAALIGLVVAFPALWTLFLDPLTKWKADRVTTFANGITLGSLQTFATNYLAHFQISYLVLTGEPQPNTTWRYMNGFGAFYWWVVPLAVVGLAATFRYITFKPQRAWIWLWLLAYPLGGALTNEGVPNAPRTLAGAPVFCILAALGLRLLLDYAASIKYPRISRAAVIGTRALFAIAVTASLTIFCWFYFTRYVHIASNAWDSGTRAMFTEVRAQIGNYDRVCFSVRPAWYSLDAYLRFYLSDIPQKKIDGISGRECFSAGTLLVTDSDHPAMRPGFAPIAMIYDVDGSKFALITGDRRSGLRAGYR